MTKTKNLFLKACGELTVGVVVAVGYELLEDAGVVFKADISGITVVMFVAYAIGVLLGARRYA